MTAIANNQFNFRTIGLITTTAALCSVVKADVDQSSVNIMRSRDEINNELSVSLQPVHKIRQDNDTLIEMHAARAGMMQLDASYTTAPYIRTYHLGLISARTVLLFQSSTRTLWVVVDQDINYTHVGGSEIHVLPTMSGYLTQHPERMPTLIRSESKILSIPHIAYPTNRNYFSISKLKGRPREFGSLRVRAGLININLTSGTDVLEELASTGAPVTVKPDSSATRTTAFLGLKLIYEGRDIMTTTTHAFYKCQYGFPTRNSRKPKAIWARLLEATTKAKVKSRSLLSRLQTPEAAVGKGKEKDIEEMDGEHSLGRPLMPKTSTGWNMARMKYGIDAENHPNLFGTRETRTRHSDLKTFEPSCSP